MARSGDPEREEIWGTWEELLLACAVSRHGTGSWESVATEIRSRILPSNSLTPQSCRQRYRALQRRFAKPAGGAATINGFRDDDGDEADLPPEVSWVEELRKLRVAELRRELERRDLSIGSLQLKVKRLQEERERESQSGGGKQDQAKKERPSSSSSPAEVVAGDRNFGRGDGPSWGESNSTAPKQGENLGDEDGQKTKEATRPGAEASDPSGGRSEKAAATAGEVSCNGSTEGAAEQATRPQSGESIAESKGGEVSRKGEREEESSDVQSSASLSRRKRRLRKNAVSGAGGGISSGGEAEAAEEVSIASAAESQPLISLLEMIRSDKYGSVFERRLESQETARYRSIVRRHVDLEILEAKLRLSGGSYGSSEFFRDLLLLSANAIVFYPQDSRESAAAVHLRELVSKEMATTSHPPSMPKPAQKKTSSTTSETATAPAPAPAPASAATPPPPAAQPQQTTTKPRPELDLAGNLLAKSTPSAPLIACRKRSSISNKATAVAAAKEKEDKSESDRKDKDKDSENKNLAKKKAGKEKPFISGTTRGLRTNKSRSSIGNAGAAKRPNLAPASSVKSKPVPESTAAETSGKAEKKNNGGGGGAATAAVSASKKQGAASFLNRMRRSSSGTLIESLKASSPSGGGGSGKGAEQKKTGKGDARKNQDSGSRQGGGGGSGKKVEETSGSGKRSVGRPPKRPAPSPTPPPAKRAREDAETAAAKTSSSSAARRRGRR